MKTDEYILKEILKTYYIWLCNMLFSIFGGERHPLNKVHRSPNVKYVIIYTHRKIGTFRNALNKIHTKLVENSYSAKYHTR